MEAVALTEDVELGYQELKRDYRILRRVLCGIFVIVIITIAITIGVVIGNRTSPVVEPSSSPAGPKGESCVLDLEVSCAVDKQASSSCNEIQSSCASRPSTLVFQYSGGNCTSSSHNQEHTSFACLDYINIDSSGEVYVVAYDIDTNQTYHERQVALDDIFWASNFNNLLGDTMNITIYDVSFENIIQTLVFQSD